MADINSFANERLLDFIDAVHEELQKVLSAKFGDAWLSDGVHNNLPRGPFERVEAMLQSPMRVVDMGKTEDEMYGIEHIWNVIDGNWDLFKKLLDNRQRTQTYLGEITELRHNLAHRRTRHVVARVDLIRILDSCARVLDALRSPKARAFEETVESLTTGSNPWGSPLEGRLPPSDEIYSAFVGRPDELNELADWLASDRPQVLVWGAGGVGKSALAYRFAREIRDGGHPSFIAVCWVSAKASQYVDGTTSSRPADFDDLESLVIAIWRALFNESDPSLSISAPELLSELSSLPTLLVVDDFDTVSEDLEITDFLLYSLRNTPTRVIYTSRRRVTGLKDFDVPPFPETQLTEFVQQQAPHYRLNSDDIIGRVDAIGRVTEGYPLYVDDLLRHASVFGIKESLEDWTQRGGDAARQYALQRQIQFMSKRSRSSGDILIALSVSSRPLSITQLAAVTGLTLDDCDAGSRELISWHLANNVFDEDNEAPALRLNNNNF